VTVDENGKVDESAYQFLSDKQISELELLKQRKDALQSKISEKDAKAIIDLVNFMKSHKIKILNSLDSVSADEV
jgi:hypothetical protein